MHIGQGEGGGGGPRNGPEAQRALDAEAALPTRMRDREIARGLELGLQGADSIRDRTIPTFSRGELPHYAGINTFLKAPYVEDVRTCGDYDVAIVGAPHDSGTTYRPGTRFGPQGIRKISALYGTYSFELGVDLRESITMCDLGDIFTIPGNIEKSFDQIAKAVSTSTPAGPSRSSWVGTTPSATRRSGGWRSTWRGTSGSSTSTGMSTPRRRTSTSGCTPPPGSTPPTSPTSRPGTWSRSGSGAGRRPGPGWRWVGSGGRPS